MAELQITPQLRAQLQAWLQEDIGRGDLSAPALTQRPGRAHWLAKAAGVFCGGVLLEPLLQGLDPATLWVSREDTHPNATADARYAAAIARWIEGAGP